MTLVPIMWKNSEGYQITTDPKAVDLDRLHHYLSNRAYWARGIPYTVLQKGIKNSLNFSILTSENLFVGFARLITDFATFAYLADVIVFDEYQGKGLGKWLMKTIMNYRELQGLRNWFLYTMDAHGLYEKYGWKKMEDTSRAMFIRNDLKEIYKNY